MAEGGVDLPDIPAGTDIPTDEDFRLAGLNITGTFNPGGQSTPYNGDYEQMPMQNRQQENPGGAAFLRRNLFRR